MLSLQPTSLVADSKTEPIRSAEKPLQRQGYKETECFWINGDCMIVSNSDVKLTEEMQFAIKLAQYFDKIHKVDLLVKNFA